MNGARLTTAAVAACVAPVVAVGDLAADRSVEADALLLVFDDPGTDSDEQNSAELGEFEAGVDAFVTIAFSSASAAAQQAGSIEENGLFEFAGVATGGLYVQGQGKASARTVARVAFDVPNAGRVLLESLVVGVDDKLDGTSSFDRPADARAEVKIIDPANDWVAYQALVVLDDLGTTSEFGDAGAVLLNPGTYELIVEAVVSDETAGFEEIKGSFAAASFEVRGRVQPGCLADIAAPFGVVDLADLQAFIGAVLSASPEAQYAFPTGQFDLGDVEGFITAFLGPCE